MPLSPAVRAPAYQRSWFNLPYLHEHQIIAVNRFIAIGIPKNLRDLRRVMAPQPFQFVAAIVDQALPQHAIVLGDHSHNRASFEARLCEWSPRTIACWGRAWSTIAATNWNGCGAITRTT